MNEAKFTNLNEFKEILLSQPIANSNLKDRAVERNNQLTKPPGALGRLEELSVWFASWNGNEAPIISSPQVVVFAGNHGVTSQGVSAFPQEVTAQMVLNFEHGGAAINQMCKTFGAKLDVETRCLSTLQSLQVTSQLVTLLPALFLKQRYAPLTSIQKGRAGSGSFLDCILSASHF